MKFRRVDGHTLFLLFEAACGAAGPFRQPTDADFAAHVERTRARPRDYLKALALMIVIGGIVAIITKWAVDG